MEQIQGKNVMRHVRCSVSQTQINNNSKLPRHLTILQVACLYSTLFESTLPACSWRCIDGHSLPNTCERPLATAVATALTDETMDVCFPPAWPAAAESADIKCRAMALNPKMSRWPLASQMERPQVISSKSCFRSGDNQNAITTT